MNTISKLLILFLVVAVASFGQATLSSTTLSAAIDAKQTKFSVASGTGVTAPGNITADSTGITVGSGTSVTILMVDKEAMQVLSVSSNTVTVRRGSNGTKAAAHVSGAKVWFGPSKYFYAGKDDDLSGACTATLQQVLPVVSLATGNAYTCPSSGPSSGKWTLQETPSISTFTDGYFFVSPAACGSAVATTAYASGYPRVTMPATGNVVYQVTTDTTGGTIDVSCPINLPSRLTSGKGVTINSVSLLYGVQTTALSAVGTAAINTVTYPTSTAGGAAAAGTVATAGGTLSVTPTSLQLTTTTAGQCFNEKITLGTPVAINTDNRTLTVTQRFTTAGSTATTLQICGVVVGYTQVPN